MNRLVCPVLFAMLMFAGSLSCGSEPERNPPNESELLREAVTRGGVLEHLQNLQEISDRNGGNRAAGSPGYDASVDYVAQRLRDAGYEVTTQRFDVRPTQDLSVRKGGEAEVEPRRDLASDFSAPAERFGHRYGNERAMTRTERIQTANVIGESGGSEGGGIVVVGAHLDSVPEGPGINDNGSGVATILEVAEEMNELDIEARNRVRFAFWGAEEIGLLGSSRYVESLTQGEIRDISVYLNFDMLGSPNGVRFVYNDRGNPRGSARVEEAFTGFFESQNLTSEPDDTLVGRSDHGPFADRGIPVGGIFSGAEGVKTAREAESYRGESGDPHDPCYHEACDTARNLDARLLDEMSDAAAHAVTRFAAAQ